MFLLLLVGSVDSIRSFSHNFKFYSFIFKHKISTHVVCKNSMSKQALLRAWNQIPHISLTVEFGPRLHSNLWSLQVTDELPKFHLGLLEA